MLNIEIPSIYWSYQGDDTMITQEDRAIFDYDLWTLVDDLMEDIWIIKNGEATREVRLKIEERIRRSCDGQETIDELMRISNAYWIRSRLQREYTRPWWRFWESQKIKI